MVPDPATQALHAERARLAGRPAPDAAGERRSDPGVRAGGGRTASRRGRSSSSTAADELVLPDESIAMYERAGEPKKLVLLPGRAHYDVYAGECFAEVMGHATDWFAAHL